MKAIYGAAQSAHDPQFFLARGRVLQNKDEPERATRLLAGLKRVGVPVIEPTRFGLGPVAAVHSPEYLTFLSTAYARWMALPDEPGREVIANVYPSRYPGTYPTGIVGQAGWHMSDTNCPIGEHTWQAALLSADTAVTAAELVLNGAKNAYALCRPPGHHAYGDMAGGSCFLNNSAIAAQHLRKQHDRVVILDIDVHHGNGTQGIFYARPDVMTVSIHCDPANFYPFHWGHRNERGTGAGEGYNLNLPLPPRSGDAVYLKAIEEARAAIETFCPTAMVVATGLDASEADPYKGMAVTTDGFKHIGAAVADFDLPTVYCQEGGYVSDILTDNLASFLTGVLGD